MNTADDVTWPVWPATLATVAVTLGAGVGVALSSPLALAGLLAVPMLLLAGGWVRLLRLPSPRGTTSMLAVAVLILLAGGLLSTATQTTLLPSAVAVVLLLEFVHQLSRSDRRPRLVESVSSAVFGIAVITSGACLLLLGGPIGRTASLTVIAAVLTGCLADLLRGRAARHDRGWVPAVLSTVLGAVTGWGVWTWLRPTAESVDIWWAVAAGLLAALVSFTLRLALSALPTIGGFRARWAAGSATLLVVGVIAYGMAWGVHGSLTPLLSAA